MKKETNPLTFEYEKSFGENLFVCGTDEAGRGPLAGPVYAAAVVLGEDCDEELLSQLNDSKKLSEKKRDTLEAIIKEKAISYAIAYSTVEEIEGSDILSASLHAMRKAIDALSLDRGLSADELAKHDVEEIGGRALVADAAIIDGNMTRGFTIPAKAIVGGDGKSFSIAASSILAKVARDRYCYEILDKKYPQYRFAKHKGYGTKLHYEKVDEFGLCDAHRKSFFKKYYDKKNSI